MLAFILQVVLFQLLFLLVYEVLLKKETFFTYNRWYLLATSVISLLLPLIKIEALAFLLPAESFSGISTVFLPEVIIGEAPAAVNSSAEVSTASSGFSINWWLVAYGTGVTASLFLFFKKYQDLSRLFRFRAIAAERDLRIIEVPNSTIACTFYKTIFLGDKLAEAERHQILSHELVHVKQKHSLDLLFFELYKIIFWFNPLIYIYQSRIATLHEFIADAEVVQTTEKKTYYEQLLNSAFNTANISFINQFFNHSLIKKRIVMLQKSKSKTISKFKFLVLLPLMLVMLTYVACSDDANPGLETSSEISEKDAALKAALWEEVTTMDAAGTDFNKIADAFIVEKDEHIKSKEGYYRFQTFARFIHTKTVEREKANGTYDENSKNPFQSILDQDYDEYVTQRKSQPAGEKREVRKANEGGGNGVPFAIIDEVPVFPGCEDTGSNEAAKKCMSEKITGFVSDNFNTEMGKELGLKGVNRVIVIFEINENGDVQNIRARAPHPDLEEEAKRVVSLMPRMQPGKQDGAAMTVSYSLPIVFQVGE